MGMANAGTLKVRKVIAEWQADGTLLVMDEAGWVREFLDPATVVKTVRLHDRRALRYRDESTISIIDWRNCPEGFTGTSEQ